MEALTMGDPLVDFRRFGEGSESSITTSLDLKLEYSLMAGFAFTPVFLILADDVLA
jgi:hypothetical protein